MGNYKCYACRKTFTVKVGTVLESIQVPIHKWLQAIFLLSDGKNVISSNQVGRALEITLKKAWCLSLHIRKALRDSSDDLESSSEMAEPDEI
jgi:transposase-like protein